MQYTSYPQLHPEGADYSTYDFSQPYAGEQAYADPSLPADPNNFSYLNNTSQAPSAYAATSLAPTPAPQASTDLVRRSRNQQLTPQNVAGVPGQEHWNGAAYGNMNGQQPEEEDEQELEQKVQIARREAQNKRKQIPPFVQKLSR
jgi:heat shock transcription factor, other eukaryote